MRRFSDRGLGNLGTFLVLLLFVVIVVILLIPALAPLPWGRPPATRARCLSNIRQIGLAMMLYKADHNKRYPDSLGALLKNGYLTRTEVFICPSSRNRVPDDFPKENFEDADVSVLNRVDEWSDYVMVRGVTPDSPRDFILLHEKWGSHNGEGGNCFFNDGVTQWLPDAELRQRMAEQEAKLHQEREKMVE